MSKPVFVSQEWCEKVDAALGDKPEQPPANVAPSRFYDVRPVSIRSEWIQEGDSASPWSADAAFIVNDTVDTSFVFPVFAYGSRPNGSETGFAVWRGRWEFLGARPVQYRSGDGITIANGFIINSGITSMTVSTGSEVRTL
jgi:hypothetical protein